MNFEYTEEQRALRDSLERFIEKEYSFDKRRARVRSEESFNREAWERFAELGLLALRVPDDCGGIGGTAVDTMLVMECLGKGLVLEPYLACAVLANTLVNAAGTPEQKQSLLRPAAEGRLLLAAALYEPEARYALNRVTTTAEVTANGWRISGKKALVLGGPSADTFIVAARTSGDADAAEGISLFLVERGTPGLDVRAYHTHDGTHAADIALRSVEVDHVALLGPAGKALPCIEEAVDQVLAALCAEAVGIMVALNDATLDYLKTRKQFGQPIGRFQALQHRMVDMVIATEQARSMTILAAVKADGRDPAERMKYLSGAKAYVGMAARTVGQTAVQLHGGMGVVDELIVSHYFKRLTMIMATLGDTDFHLDRFSKTLLAA
jgi:alkylation response protein AidB-like acyl-CoA dehydrogenase